ncbi:MAG: trypsin-like serine protease [Verrucomicrobiae bacterium]|nr:trypsin-like serine protease [Verrucomicrobiae bacterium]
MKSRSTALTRRHTWRALLPVTLLAAATLPAPAITNGEVDTDNRHANVGAVVLVNDLPDYPEYPAPHVFSSGTLIHPRVLLTAGHLVDQVERAVAAGLGTLDDLRVSFGVNAYDPATWLEVAAIAKHPAYDSRFAEVPGGVAGLPDIGVVILKEPVTDVPLGQLPSPFLLDDLLQAGQLRNVSSGAAHFPVVGYGRHITFPPSRAEDRPDGLRRFTHSGFKALRSDWLLLSTVWARGYGGNADHDSGGPIFWQDSVTGQLTLVAVVSGGDIHDVAHASSSRVDTPAALSFIEAVIEAVEGDQD